jgi:hypothetical protein
MSNAVQIRDASDLTTYKKRGLMVQNYNQLSAKDQKPKGGIPHYDLMNFGFARTPAIPAGSILTNIIGPPGCPLCFNQVEVLTTEIISEGCSPACEAPYSPESYQNYQSNGS